MATTTFTPPAPFGAITAHRFVAFIERVLQAASDARSERRTRVELNSLSDDILRDIGLTRWDLESNVR